MSDSTNPQLAPIEDPSDSKKQNSDQTDSQEEEYSNDFPVRVPSLANILSDSANQQYPVDAGNGGNRHYVQVEETNDHERNGPVQSNSVNNTSYGSLKQVIDTHNADTTSAHGIEDEDVADDTDGYNGSINITPENALHYAAYYGEHERLADYLRPGTNNCTCTDTCCFGVDMYCALEIAKTALASSAEAASSSCNSIPRNTFTLRSPCYFKVPSSLST
jgi:hypothetical protein